MKKLLSLLLLVFCVSLGASGAVKCKATTQKGTRCTRVAKQEGYCTQHYKIQQKKKTDPNYVNKAKQVSEGGKPKKATSDATRCTAKTKKGTRCKLMALPGTNRCATHTK